MNLLRISLPLLLTACIVLTGCRRNYIDTDHRHDLATTINPDVRIEDGDGLDAEGGDTDDWKVFQATKNGLGVIRVDFGDPFKGTQGVKRGVVRVLTSSAKLVSQADIRPGKARYELSFKVKEDKRYFVHLRADRGAGPYAIKYGIKKRKKRCANCRPGEDFCHGKKCLAPDAYDPPAECEEPCGRSEICVRSTMFGVPECVPKRGGETCDTVCERIMDATPHFYRAKYFYDRTLMKRQIADFGSQKDALLKTCRKDCRRGSLDTSCLAKARSTDEMLECSATCPGGCARGSTCNKRRKRCVKSPCAGVRCGPGERCSGGKCVTRPVKRPSCIPLCGPDYKCNKRKGVCEFALGPIDCTVTSISSQGNRTTFIVNRGNAHKVYKGDRGNLKGVGSFRIIDVYAVRSKALIKKPASVVRTNTGCRLNRKGPKK